MMRSSLESVRYLAAFWFATFTLGGAVALRAQSSNPHVRLADYLMQPEAEQRLAASAAPSNITADATFEVLTENGYRVASKGSNGFTCLVLRSWAAPTFGPGPLREPAFSYPALRAPICYDSVASRTVLPYQKLRARLGLQGKSLDEIAHAVSEAYASGELHRMEGVSFAYMFSADQDLGPGVGAWHPHMMVFAPYYENAMLGGNPLGGPLPFVGDDPGTPFTVTVIPVDHALAIAAGVSR
jgi:hypothetical protein